MCELLSAIRRVPIEPPGGAAPALGDPANPAYSVAISNREAADARDKHALEAESTRLFPTPGGPLSSMKEAASTAFENSAESMIAGITGRRNGSVKEGVRQSSESMRISQDSKRHAPGPYLYTSSR